MRSAWLVAAVMLGGAAQAATLVDEGRFEHNLLLPDTTENRVIFRMGDVPGDFVTITFPAVADDTVWVVNASTADDFGANWSDLVAWSAALDLPRIMLWQYGPGPSLNLGSISPNVDYDSPPIPPPYFLRSFTLESLTFVYGVHPKVIGPSLASLQFGVIGQGTIAPEPTTVSLTMGLGLLVLMGAARLRHGSRASTRSSRS